MYCITFPIHDGKVADFSNPTVPSGTLFSADGRFKIGGCQADSPAPVHRFPHYCAMPLMQVIRISQHPNSIPSLLSKRFFFSKPVMTSENLFYSTDAASPGLLYAAGD
jgi:hypothetical protein